MAKTNAVVVRVMADGKADVVAEKQGGCGSCSASHSCHTSKSALKMKTTVINPVDAGPGDLVAIDVSTASVLKGMALVYLLPVFGLMSGAIIGSSMAGDMSMSQTGGAVLFSGIGLVLGFGLVISISKLMGSSDAYTPVITRIIKKGWSEPVISGPAKPVPDGCPGTSA